LHEADTIYLVGDIVDGWALRSSWYWPQAHNNVVQKLLRKGRKGARIVYVSFPKMSSGLDSLVRQNHCIIRTDACNPALARNVRPRLVQVAVPA
jgi:UDP-2,3-diacylglucosamine pyrophosphatase LpxH